MTIHSKTYFSMVISKGDLDVLLWHNPRIPFEWLRVLCSKFQRLYIDFALLEMKNSMKHTAQAWYHQEGVYRALRISSRTTIPNYFSNRPLVDHMHFYYTAVRQFQSQHNHSHLHHFHIDVIWIEFHHYNQHCNHPSWTNQTKQDIGPRYMYQFERLPLGIHLESSKVLISVLLLLHMFWNMATKMSTDPRCLVELLRIPGLNFFKLYRCQTDALLTI